MTDRVFYSWQTDSPNNINRGFISTALEKAVLEIKNDDEIAVEPVIDRDTLGVPGSPDISESIFDKIENSSVFVCDVSIIDKDANRKTPNPNVLIELGYAIKVLGWTRIVMVMNTEFGGPDTLPFDLRGKRTLTYKISSSDVEKAPVRNNLQKTFVYALKLIFEKAEDKKLIISSITSEFIEDIDPNKMLHIAKRIKSLLTEKSPRTSDELSERIATSGRHSYVDVQDTIDELVHSKVLVNDSNKGYKLDILFDYYFNKAFSL